MSTTVLMPASSWRGETVRELDLALIAAADKGLGGEVRRHAGVSERFRSAAAVVAERQAAVEAARAEALERDAQAFQAGREPDGPEGIAEAVASLEEAERLSTAAGVALRRSWAALLERLLAGRERLITAAAEAEAEELRAGLAPCERGREHLAATAEHGGRLAWLTRLGPDTQIGPFAQPVAPGEVARAIEVVGWAVGDRLALLAREPWREREPGEEPAPVSAEGDPEGAWRQALAPARGDLSGARLGGSGLP